MRLELLPNELFFDIFQFLATHHLLSAFHGLNARFDELLYKHYQVYHLADFRSMSNKDFDIFCKEYLPQMVDQITSIRLSDSYYMAHQINRFDAYGFTFGEFTRLQSLSFLHIYSEHVAKKIMLCLPNLRTLTHLTFEECSIEFSGDHGSSFMNSIWNLPNLVYCYLDVDMQQPRGITMPTVISPSIQYLSGFRGRSYIYNIVPLLEHTPLLQCLSANEVSIFTNPTSNFELIIKLELSLGFIDLSKLLNMLRLMPNLCHLKIDTQNLYVHGKIWEKVCRRYLLKIKTLQFKMIYTLANKNSNREKHIDDILDSFKSDFWLLEHKWFIQCLWEFVGKKIFVYTLPYVFDEFNFAVPIHAKSTCPSEHSQWSYDDVRFLNYKPNFYVSSFMPIIQFFKLHHIIISLPISNHFQSMVPTLQHLTTLEISTITNDQNCLSRLQFLLDQASHLRLLTICDLPLNNIKMVPFQLKSLSVCELNLRSESVTSTRCYNLNECIQLTGSLLFMQCKRLTINVVNQECIYELVLRMNRLQALQVSCQEENSHQSLEAENGDFTKWLKKRLQSTTILISSFIRHILPDRGGKKREIHILIER